MKLPISVIVPFSKHRDAFFYRFCLPSIQANNPEEIIVESEEASAPVKRNKGAHKAGQPYLFFCDDDAILAVDCLKTMLHAIDGQEEAFAYSHFAGIVTQNEAHPLGENFINDSCPFDRERLEKHNYIDTMSLLKKEFFPGFDETLNGYQDWDLWLTITKSGAQGKFIDDVLYMKFYFDRGISSDAARHLAAKETVRKKHHLLDNYTERD